MQDNPVQYPRYDLAVIGGGINGAAIARDASMRGMKVILLEKEDFGFGASTKTSKLAHGGLRYLELFHFGLVKESLKERELLLKNAPHLVKPLPFLFPVYHSDKYPLWQVQLGLLIYDFLSGSSKLPKSKKLKATTVNERFPHLKSENLKGGCLYYDVQMLDHRILIENVLAAEQNGAVVRNYAKVDQFIIHDGKVQGLIYRDAFSGVNHQIEALCFVNATGAWSNELTSLEPNAGHPQVAPSKGVHIVLPPIEQSGALILRTPQDGRVFFILPWEGCTLVGTTDTRYKDDPDVVSTSPEDILYLLEAFNFYYPGYGFHKESILADFVGLRPLIDEGDSSTPSKLSREHVVDVSSGGLVTVLGGKYTTYRQIAEEVVDVVSKRLGGQFAKCQTKDIPLPGAMGGSDSLDKIVVKCTKMGLSQQITQHLIGHYGVMTERILEIIDKDPSQQQKIVEELPYLHAEVTYAIEYEHVKTAEDWLYRRSNMGLFLKKPSDFEWFYKKIERA